MKVRKSNSQSGFSVIELIVTLGMSSVLTGMAIMNLKDLDDPLKNGAEQMTSFMRVVRARAISSTRAYTVFPVSNGQLAARYADTCSNGATTPDTSMTLEFPTGARLTDTAWDICFNSRGLPDGNLAVELRDSDGEYKTVEVFLGGGVRVDA
ncbi:MAG: GspH/FimT family pseudopilin [Oligoflexia bacterium]|nr:GspH/FimT family pseudopilin [Oligoflexia bacterium]